MRYCFSERLDSVKRTWNNIGWLASEKIINIAGALLVTTAVARYLGPILYGKMALILALVGVFSSVASMGASHINISQFSKKNNTEKYDYLQNAIVARLLWAFVCVIAYIIISHLYGGEISILQIMAAVLIPTASLSVYSELILSEGFYSRYAKTLIGVTAAALTCRLLGISTMMDMSYFIFISIAEAVLGCLLFGLLVRSGYKYLRFEISYDKIRHYIKLCFPTAVSTLLIGLYLRFEFFAIGKYLGNASAAYWAIAMMFLTPWNLVASSVISISNRDFASATRSVKERNLFFQKLLRKMMLFAIAAILINCSISNFVVKMFFGPIYSEKISGFLWICSLQIVPFFLGTVQEIWIANTEKTSVVLKKVIAVFPVSAILVYFLMAKYAEKGAAIAMVTSGFVSAFLLNYFYDREFFRIQLKAIGIISGSREDR